MSNKIIQRFIRDDIMNNIKLLLNEGSKIKTEIFKSIIMKRDYDKNVVDGYIGYVNGFLRFWNDYANELKTTIRDLKANIDVPCVPYNDVKDYIYANNDYASVLQFTDGVIKGMDSGKFTKPNDITEFFEYTVSKAFHKDELTVASLLDRSVTVAETYGKSDHNEVTKFDVVKKYDIANVTDRIQLSKAIEETVMYLFRNSDDYMHNEYEEASLYAAMVNSIVEYINYSLTVYATRIYVIARYSYPHIFYKDDTVEVVKESADVTAVCVMKDAEEVIFRDFNKYDNVRSIMDTFLNAIGVEGLYSTSSNKFKHYDIDINEYANNLFISKLKTNKLYEFFTNPYNNIYDMNDNEFNHTISELIYNRLQGVETSTSSKQGLMNIIKNTKPSSDTFDEWKTLAKDFAIFSADFLIRLRNAIRRYEFSPYNHKPENLETTVSVNKSIKTLSEFYRDIAVAILYRFRDIEMHINNLRNAVIDRTFSSFKLDIPGKINSDYNPNDMNMMGVPETTRLPLEMLDIYAKPTYEYLQMIDEYVMEEYGLQDDPYFKVGYYSESISIAEIFRKIIAAFTAFITRCKEFFNNEQFKRACAWVEKNQNALMQMQFTGTMSVLPYTKDVKISHIDRMISTINSFDENNMKTEEDVQEFLDSLYHTGNKSIAELFDTTKYNDNEANTLYTNFILFDKDPLNKNDMKITPLTLDSSDKIKEQLEIWIGNVANSETTHKSLTTTGNKINTAINSLKTKVLGSQSGTASNQQTTTPPPETLTSVKDNSTSTSTSTSSTQVGNTVAPASQQKKEEDVNNKQLLVDKVLMGISIATEKMWVGLYGPITKALKDQYQYIKEAHSLGRSK